MWNPKKPVDCRMLHISHLQKKTIWNPKKPCEKKKKLSRTNLYVKALTNVGEIRIFTQPEIQNLLKYFLLIVYKNWRFSYFHLENRTTEWNMKLHPSKHKFYIRFYIRLNELQYFSCAISLFSLRDVIRAGVKYRPTINQGFSDTAKFICGLWGKFRSASSIAHVHLSMYTFTYSFR